MNHIDATRQGQCVYVRLTGEFARDAADDMDAVLAAVPGAPTLVLDLSAADHLGGVGIAYLIKLQTRLSTRGGELFLCNLSGNVSTELAMRELSGFFRVVDGWDADMGEEILPLLAAK